MSLVIPSNQENFGADVLNAEHPVLVDFYADWCSPCKALAPLLDDLAADQSGQLDIVKINIDESPDLAHTYGVRSIPTLALFKNGEVVSTRTGLQSRGQLHAWVVSPLHN